MNGEGSSVAIAIEESAVYTGIGLAIQKSIVMSTMFIEHKLVKVIRSMQCVVE